MLAGHAGVPCSILCQCTSFIVCSAGVTNCSLLGTRMDRHLLGVIGLGRRNAYFSPILALPFGMIIIRAQFRSWAHAGHVEFGNTLTHIFSSNQLLIQGVCFCMFSTLVQRTKHMSSSANLLAEAVAFSSADGVMQQGSERALLNSIYCPYSQFLKLFSQNN